jgi:aldehyde reductase
LAKKYGRTPAQIILRWGIQRKTVVIPKSSRVERLEENIKIFDYELSSEDMEIIKGLDKKYRTNNPVKFWGIDLFA